MVPQRQRSRRRFLPPSIWLLKHGGIVSVVNSADWIRHWRYPNDVMLAVPWPTFFGLVAAAYLLLNLTFSCLYWLDRHGISGVAGQSTRFDDAFFFSVQTLGSIGYGALYPSNIYTNLIVSLESLMGIVFIALITGLAFRRFSRSTPRILFSEVATMHDYDGQHTLMFRLANERSRTILQARIQAYLAIDERTVEGHRMRRLYPMRLQREHSPYFCSPGRRCIPSTRPAPGMASRSMIWLPITLTSWCRSAASMKF
ncbi:MAG: ion channel [Prochlorococcaceae cyanobacterium]